MTSFARTQLNHKKLPAVGNLKSQYPQSQFSVSMNDSFTFYLEFCNALLQNIHQILEPRKWAHRISPFRKFVFCGQWTFRCRAEQNPGRGVHQAEGRDLELLQLWVLTPAKIWCHRQIPCTILLFLSYESLFNTQTGAPVEAHQGRELVSSHLFDQMAQPCL